MRNLFGNKRAFFALGFITGAVLVIIFSFAVPGKRTYIGGEKMSKETWAREIMTQRPMESAKREAEKEITEVSKKEEKISGEEYRVSPSKKSFLEILKEQGKVPRETEEATGKSEGHIEAEESTGISEEPGTRQYAEKESMAFPVISHDDIPARWEYKD